MIRTPRFPRFQRFIVPLVLAAAAAFAVPAQLAAQVPEMSEEVKQVRKYYLQCDDEACLVAANEYLVAHPGDPFVLELRARALRQLGRFQDAAKTAEAIQPVTARSKLLQAECLGMDRASATQAHAIVDEVAADDPNAIAPHIVRARIYLAQGRLKEAASELNYVRTSQPKLYEGQLLAGFLAESTAQTDEALKLYLPLVTKAGDFEQTDSHHQRDAVIALAGCYLKLQDYDNAIGLYEQLTQRFPKSPVVLSQYALALAMKERTADAMTMLEKAIELAPAVPDFRIRLAELYRTAGRSPDAIAQFKKALEVSGGQTPAQLVADRRLAELLLEAGEIDNARVHALAALALAPEDEEVLTVNARLREKLGDTTAAKESYRKALAKNPLTFDAMYRLSLLLARSTEPAEQEEGKALLERHKKIEPYLQEIRRAQRELELAPRSPMIITRLAAFLNLAGEYEQAKKLAEFADKLHSRSPSTCIQLAYISANLGDWKAALGYFQRAQSMLPKNSVPKLDEYIEKLNKGESLAVPMGEYFRPAQTPEVPAPGN